jgi:hypothetical protein
MDSLHNVLRSIRGETKGEIKSRRDHLDVFREFLDHLDRAAKRRAAPRNNAKGRGKRGKR